MSVATRAYRVKGSTTDVTACGLCGREDLKGTVVLAELDADGNEIDVVYFGSDCGSKAAGWTQAEMRKRTRAADDEQRAADARARQARHDAENAAFVEWVRDRYGITITQPADLHAHKTAVDGLSPFDIRKLYTADTGQR